MAASLSLVVKFLLAVGQRYHGGLIQRQALFLGLSFMLIGVILHIATPAVRADRVTVGRNIIKNFILLMAVPLLFLSYAHQSCPTMAAEATRFAQAVLESLVEILQINQ